MPKQKKKAAARPGAPATAKKQGAKGKAVQTAEYRHKDETPARPDVGIQPQFREKAPPKTYKYDASLSPALDFDANNPAREGSFGKWTYLVAKHPAAVRKILDQASKELVSG